MSKKADASTDMFSEWLLSKAISSKDVPLNSTRSSDAKHISAKTDGKNKADKTLYALMSQKQKDNMLFCAVKDNDLAKMEGLLQNNANPNITDDEGRTPLMFIKSSQAVELLLKYRADRLAVDIHGCSVKDNIKQNKSHIQNKKFCLELISEPSLYEFDFLHAGSEPFSKENMKEISPNHWANNFDGGLWTAPYNPLTNQSVWQDFWYNEGMDCNRCNQTEHVVLHDDCKILIYSPNNPEAKKYLKKDKYGGLSPSITDISRDYDALYVPDKHTFLTPFHGWEVTTLAIFNKDKIDVFSHQAYAEYAQKKKDKVYFAQNNCNPASIAGANNIEDLRRAIKNYDEYKGKHQVTQFEGAPITDEMSYYFERRKEKEEEEGNLSGEEIFSDSISHSGDYEDGLRRIRLYTEYFKTLELTPEIVGVINKGLDEIYHLDGTEKQQIANDYLKTLIDIGYTPNQLLQNVNLENNEEQILCRMMTQKQKDEMLVCCVKNNALAKMEFFLQNGADSNVFTDKFKTPLLSLAQDFQASELLLQYGAKPDAVNIFNQSSLFSAKSPKQVTVLLKYGANPLIKDKYKKTAIDYLSNLNNKSIINHTKCVNLIKTAIIRRRKEKFEKIFKILKIKQFIALFHKQKSVIKELKVRKAGTISRAKKNDFRRIA